MSLHLSLIPALLGSPIGCTVKKISGSHVEFRSSSSGIPNPWAAAHYWPVSYLQTGHGPMCMCIWTPVSGGPAYTHVQLDVYEWWASAHTCATWCMWAMGWCTHTCACNSTCNWVVCGCTCVPAHCLCELNCVPVYQPTTHVARFPSPHPN